MTSSADSTVTIAQKFQAFYDLFTEFTQDAAEQHTSLQIQDDPSRAIFNSMSRILGFCDQLNLLISLMREDVRVIDELVSDPIHANWTDEIEHCYYEWLKTARAAIPTVH